MDSIKVNLHEPHGRRTFKVITLDAKNPYERGCQYGELARHEIQHAIDFYKKKFEKGPGWERAVEFSKKFIPVAEDFFRDAMEEIRGIGQASGYKTEEIMTVNARYELSQFDWHHECTTGVFFDKDRGKNYIFKNCDLGYDVMPHLLILRVQGEDGYRAVGITEAGQLVRDGYNSFGVAMVNSALMSKEDHAGIAVPGTFVRKRVWESKSFSQACEVQRHLPRTVSTNMLIADKYGNAIDFECYPGGEDEVVPRKGIIGTGNRFTINPSRNRWTEDVNEHVMDRGRRLWGLLEGERSHMSVETIMDILRDHEGYPYSICGHGENKEVGTVYSLIINMTDDKLYICCGNPCKGAYEEFTL